MPDGTTHYSTLLGNISVKYRNSSYVADRAFPMVPVVKDTNNVAVYGFENLRVDPSYRADGSAAHTATHSYSNTTYNLQYHALRDIVTDRQKDNADAPISALEVDVTENLTDKILLRRERDVRDVIFTTTTWAANTTLVSTTSWRFNTTTSGDPSIHVWSAASAIVRNSGQTPNVALIGYPTLALLAHNTFILDRIRQVMKGVASAEVLASLWNLEEVMVGTATENTGLEGIANSNTAVWNNNCWVAYRRPNPGLRSPTAGVIFQKEAAGARVKRWRDEAYDGNWIEVQMAYDPQALATASAYLITATDL